MIEVLDQGGIHIKSWVPSAELEYEAIAQMGNMSRLPHARYAALMPDAHPGYGMPIGGVIAMEGVVVPYAIGVDIGCSVTLLGIAATEISQDKVKALMDRVRRDIPVGNGPHGQHKDEDLWDAFGPAIPEGRQDVLEPFLGTARAQLGTLGGGNHFLELQQAVEGVDEGKLFFMIHSGSRSLGKKVADHHVRIAQQMARMWAVDLPHKDVAFLPMSTDEGKAYWTDMEFAMAFAQGSHLAMAQLVIDAVSDVLGEAAVQLMHCHHNFAAYENHHGKNLIVHRKGAVRARAEDDILIPGSMSTGSYVAQGLNNPDALYSSPHGAGRLRSRAKTRELITQEAMSERMAEKGVYLTSPGDVRDESEWAYKDIFTVMERSSELVLPVTRLAPLGVVKG